MLWAPSPSQGLAAATMAGILYGGYGPPGGEGVCTYTMPAVWPHPCCGDIRAVASGTAARTVLPHAVAAGLDMAEWSGDAPLIDDPSSLEYNVGSVVEALCGRAADQFSKYPGNDVSGAVAAAAAADGTTGDADVLRL